MAESILDQGRTWDALNVRVRVGGSDDRFRPIEVRAGVMVSKVSRNECRNGLTCSKCLEMQVDCRLY